MTTIVILGLIALLVWFWYDALRTREAAIRYCTHACRNMNAILLDQTVALESIRPVRNQRGAMVWRRIYGFDFTVAGYERRRGRIIMSGQQLEQMQIDSEQGTTIEMSS
ncbi:MAG: DUF3301 domain-containing protein [Thiothrix sp.]|nr:DUF3301 domain-containing protein [Thiothrix sp.]HPE61652.1 DUF3301 domain-containing protein [Thiolinea sp.]